MTSEDALKILKAKEAEKKAFGYCKGRKTLRKTFKNKKSSSTKKTSKTNGFFKWVEKTQLEQESRKNLMIFFWCYCIFVPSYCYSWLIVKKRGWKLYRSPNPNPSGVQKCNNAFFHPLTTVPTIIEEEEEIIFEEEQVDESEEVEKECGEYKES